MKVNNKVEPLNVIDIESKTLYLDQSKEFASANPESQINQKNEIDPPIADQENGISLLHYFSWLSDLFLSIVSTGVLAIIPMHNMLEVPSYW